MKKIHYFNIYYTNVVQSIKKGRGFSRPYKRSYDCQNLTFNPIECVRFWLY